MVGLVTALGIGLLLIVGGGTFMLLSSTDDSEALAEEELNRLMASWSSPSESSASERSTSTRSASLRESVTSTLSVVSDPPNATVLIDYDSVGVTPLQNHPLAPGVYILSVADESNLRLDTVIVVRDSGPQRSVAIDLSGRASMGMRSGDLLASNDPEGSDPRSTQQELSEPSERLPVAESTSGGSSASAAQATAARQPPDSQASSQTANSPPPRVRRNDNANFGRMSISSTPEGAEVQVDGQTVGVTPLELPRVRIGERTITMSLQNHRTATSVIDLRSRQSASVHETLAPEVGEVTIRVKPWGTIFIDGQLHGRDLDVQYVTRLTAGTHRITVFHPAFQEHEQVVDVKPNGSHQITIDLAAEARATSDRQ